ncbi:MAG: Rap1a/Tai family immunity protein [Methylophilus sp.]
MKTIIILCFAMYTSAAYSLTGSDYMHGNSTSRFYYTAGAIDNYQIAATSPCIDKISSKNYEQLAAVVYNYISSNPKYWHYPANYLINAALFEAFCS